MTWAGGGALTMLLMVILVFSGLRYMHDIVKALAEAPFIDFAHYYT